MFRNILLRFVFMCGCLLFAFQAVGQYTLSGRVQDSDGKPFPFANVLLLNAQDSTLIKGTLTGDDGTYQFQQVQAGNFMVAASMVGYTKAYSARFVVQATPGSLQLGVLELLERNTQLKEVDVVAQKPLYEQHLDRLVVNVQNSIMSAGASALDVLERSPGVTVNRQANALSMSGKTGVVIMINGKPSQLPMASVIQMLAGMNAGSVDKIEIMATSSAKYDAEGNAGIINLVLKVNEDYGTNGSYSLSAAYGLYEKLGGNFNLNHRTEKLNLYADYSFLRNHDFNVMETFRQSTHQGQLTQTTGITRRQPITTNHTARLGIDYSLTPSTTVRGLVSGFSNLWETGPVDERGSAENLVNYNLQNKVETTHEEQNHWRHLMGNLNLNHKINTQQEVSLDLDYLYYHDDNPHHYTNTFTLFSPPDVREEQLSMKKTTPIRLWVGKLDYLYNLGKSTKLEAGIKATTTRLKNKVEVQDQLDGMWQPNTEFSQHIRMLEDIGAVYVNLDHQLPYQVKLQSGLRYEYTHTDLATVDEEPIVERRYGRFFPSLFLSRDLNEKSSLQLSYSRRITRPTYNNLAPFVYFIDPNSFMSGNSNLKPAITDAVQATYRFRDNYLVSLGYSYDDAPIASWQIHLDSATNKQYARAENMKHARSYSLNFSFPLPVTSWWQVQSNFMGVWLSNTGLYQGQEVTLRSGYGSMNIVQTFLLPKNFSAELSGFYQTRSPFGISYFRAFGSLNAGLQKKLNSGKGMLRLSIDDIFWTRRFRMIADQQNLNLYASFEGAFSDPRVVRLTFTRNFGNQKMKGANRRETSSEEERNRAAGS